MDAKELEFKLWHIGGNNVASLKDIDEMEVSYPIYNSCDWYFDGLRIFQCVKNRFESRGISIKILTPPPPLHKYLSIDLFMHKSKWNYEHNFSEFDRKIFSTIKQGLITN